jgi:hypothetical protein
VYADLEDEATSPIDFAPWIDLQEWIAERETRAVVPFVRALAALMPVSATRLRRDFASLLSLVRAHALLYQAQRETDSEGRIIAAVEGDYVPVRDLVGALIAEGVEAGVSDTIRDTVKAVQDLEAAGIKHPSPKALAEKLGVGRSATYDRIRRALMAGYLVNEACRDERGMQLAVGAQLPGADDFLPTPEDIVRHMSDWASGHENDLAMRVPDASSGRPARPAGEGLDVDEDEIERLAAVARDLQPERDDG